MVRIIFPLLNPPINHDWGWNPTVGSNYDTPKMDGHSSGAPDTSSAPPLRPAAGFEPTPTLAPQAQLGFCWWDFMVKKKMDSQRKRKLGRSCLRIASS